MFIHYIFEGNIGQATLKKCKIVNANCSSSIFYLRMIPVSSSAIMSILCNFITLYTLAHAGVPLNLGYLVVGNEELVSEETVMHGSSSRGIPRSRKTKQSVQNWKAREIHECLSDAEILREDLIASLEARKSCIHPLLRDFVNALISMT